MNIRKHLFGLLIGLVLTSIVATAQDKKSKTAWDSTSYSGLKFRSIGPAFMSGRISDIAIDPTNDNHWYVAVGSGGVWETMNAGVTWKSIFDGQKVYAIGCITIDPKQPNVVWVGTGENVGGRHISYGDGVYRSTDGGKSWKNMGLKTSNHISKIVLHPTDANTLWVASQGPLWSSGGERGIYKSTDGGTTWKRTLGDDEWMGATELVIDPRNPDVLYAASWQRHRTVASYMGGGPKSGLHKSTDGGETWTMLKGGLPGGNMGKIGLAMSPQQPDVLYAAIELDLRKGAVYRTANGGASWKKMSDKVAGGTGPHYYQELYACPHNFDRIYFANNYLLVSNNGGKDFTNVKKKNKHVDNHAVVFRKNDPNYLLVGTDGGLYESFDLAENWRHFGNMPLTQFYKIAIDDAMPFYNVYGGTQDNSTQGGPSRTDNRSGIRNADWRVVNGGDGHQPATEPGNPRVVYAQSQQGYYNRKDMYSGESVSIRPQPKEGESFERYNWDAPILVSPHDPARIYVASHRVFRSDNRGDKWDVISDDLTRNEERFDLKIMGRKQSFNNPWDVYAMSTYNTITCISESPKQKDLLYIGTDDGLIHVSEDGGDNWSKTDVSSISGVSSRMYVNDIKADLHDPNTVYLLLDNHKTGDYKPYVFVSNNKGRTWNSISSNLPANNYAWRIVQDHVNPKLLFIGTEFGLYFSPSGGQEWIQLKGGLPTISFRDLAIHQREDDLVAASFGRSIYVFDDIAALREISKETIAEEAHLFSLRDAYWFTPKSVVGRGKRGSLGGQQFVADNPPFGAVFTYHIKESYTTLKSKRTKEEAKLAKSKSNVNFPGWDQLEAEKNEVKPSYYIVIKDEQGSVIRKIKAKDSKGFHRTAWDLRATSQYPIGLGVSTENRGGYKVLPGVYNASLVKVSNDGAKVVSDEVSFKVKPLVQGIVDKERLTIYKKFQSEFMEVNTKVQAYNFEFSKVNNMLKSLESAAKNSALVPGDVEKQLSDVKARLIEMKKASSGYTSKDEVGEKNNPSLNDRIWAAGGGFWSSTYGPTETARECLLIADKQVQKLSGDLKTIEAELRDIYRQLISAGAPVIQGWD